MSSFDIGYMLALLVVAFASSFTPITTSTMVFAAVFYAAAALMLNRVTRNNQ